MNARYTMTSLIYVFYIVLSLSIKLEIINCATPIVVATWGFVNSTQAAWEVLSRPSGTAIDAVVTGCSKCESLQCDGSVGFGGSPDEHGETALDAMIMDGSTFEAGAVANLRNIKDAIKVAHAVMKYSKHTLLVGSLATEFAESMGFKAENLSTPESIKRWTEWKNDNCQPNYRQNVSPDPATSCGPYSPVRQDGNVDFKVPEFLTKERVVTMKQQKPEGHDTVGMVAIDRSNNVAGGTSTNGATFKVPGRVGDSPIIGSGAYADNAVGGAAATGDGDIMMRFLPSFYAVELMRSGLTPAAAAQAAVDKIARIFPTVSAGVVAVNVNGEYGGACHGFTKFEMTVMSPDFTEIQTLHITCT